MYRNKKDCEEATRNGWRHFIQSIEVPREKIMLGQVMNELGASKGGRRWQQRVQWRGGEKE